MATNSITVNGTPASGTAVDGGYDVALGDLARGDTGVVRYTVTVDRDVHDRTLSAPVWIVDGSTLSPLGSFTVSLAALWMTAPEHVTSPTFPVNGSAPPGSVVHLFDSHGTGIGTASAGPGGLWSTTVTLPDALNNMTYPISADTTYRGEALSASATVTYDSAYPQPRSITVGQPDGRDHTFNPADGIAYFTLVFVPSKPVRVRATFTDVSRLKNPRAWVGNNSAPMTCDTGTQTCSADVTVSDWSAGTDVWLDYDVAPTTSGSNTGPAPTKAQALAGQPGQLDGLQVTDSSVSADGLSTQIDTEVPGTGVGLDFTFTAGEGPVPTGSPLMFNGVPIYTDLHASATGDGPTGFAMTVSIPESYLNSSGQTATQALRTAGFTTLADVAARLPKVRPSLTLPSKAAAVFGTIGKIAGPVLTAYKVFSHIYHVPDKDYVKLSDLTAEINNASCLTDLQKKLLRDEVTIAGYQIISVQMMEGLTPIPLFLGGGEVVDGLEATAGVTFTGLGRFLAKFDLSTLVNGAYQLYRDHIMNGTANDVKRAMAASGCKPPPPGPSGTRVAKPKFIIDPSGHVTDATTGTALTGATAVVQTAPTAHGPWMTWQAAAFGQTNPQLTATDGAYGWDTPVGWYRIKVSKVGYHSAYTRAVHVLPEWTTLDVALRPLANSPGHGTSAGPGSSLASTGTDVPGPLGAGLLLIVLGLVLSALGRRRPRSAGQ